MKKILTFAFVALLTSCLPKHGALSLSLSTVVDSFISKHPSWDVIELIASKLDGHDLLFIVGEPTYFPEFIDGYCIYKNRLLTYYQTDSLDRSSLIDTTYMQRYNGDIENYKDTYKFPCNSEPSQEIYVIKNNNELVLVDDSVKLKFNRKLTKGNNVIKNKELNEFINSYIYNKIDVLYELRFSIKDNKQYVIFRSFSNYDKEKYDGYFYRNGSLIVLYGVNNAKGLIDNTWIKKGKYGIPNTRNIHMNEKLWTFPYPKAFEILPNGHLRELSHEEAFINVL